MNNKNFFPYIRLAMDDTIEYPFKIDRVLWDFEIIYIENGSMKIKVGSRTLIAREGDIVFLRPGIPHVLSFNNERVHQPHIHFDLVKDELSDKIGVSMIRKEHMTREQLTYFRLDNLKEIGFDLPILMHSYDKEAVSNIIHDIIDEFTLKKNMFDLYITSLIIKLFVELKRGYQILKQGQRFKHRLAFDKLDKYIIHNYHRNPSLDELANVVGISKLYFIDLFKKQYGTTPHKYINELRVNRATTQLLYFNNLSISDIAKALHFDSLQSFSTWLKKETGMYPKEFRKKK